MRREDKKERKQEGRKWERRGTTKRRGEGEVERR